MNGSTFEQVREFMIDHYTDRLAIRNIKPEDVTDDFDLLIEGIIDSLGILELITSVEEHFKLEIDFEELEAEDITIIGPFCRHVAGLNTTQ